jgi:hypothetical protein
MALALIANIALSALVFTAVIMLLSRGVRAPRRLRRVRRAPAGGGQTAWTSTPAASRIRTPAIGGSDR